MCKGDKPMISTSCTDSEKNYQEKNKIEKSRMRELQYKRIGGK